MGRNGGGKGSVGVGEARFVRGMEKKYCKKVAKTAKIELKVNFPLHCGVK